MKNAHRLSLILLALLFIFMSCDDYNIVEPRFFEEEDLFWGYRVSDIEPYINFGFSIPRNGEVTIYVVNRAGSEIAVLFNDYLGAGSWQKKVELRDGDGDYLGPGIYGVVAESGDYYSHRWVEIYHANL